MLRDSSSSSHNNADAGSNEAAVSDARVWQERVQEWVAASGIINEEVERTVLRCFSAVSRRPFVEPQYDDLVLRDVAIPLPHNQWLTHPSLLIRMMALIQLRRRMRVLELGFGSGYLCAVMAAARCQVFGVEAVGVLAQSSRRLLDTLGHHGIVVRRGEGRKGWPEAAPFDAIVTSYQVQSEAELPLAQLAPGGVLLAPLQEGPGVARLTLWSRSQEQLKRVVFEEV
jgi:protein-L-isoaspartate(D-aspartate) O-methyltransferase